MYSLKFLFALGLCIMFSYSYTLADVALIFQFVDAETSKNIPGVQIKVNGADSATVSNEDGLIYLTLPKGKHHLDFEKVSYLPMHRDITIDKIFTSRLVIKLIPYGFTTATVSVVADGDHSKLEELTDHSHILAGKDLQTLMGQTLASTLKNEVGLSVRSMGPAPARPVIRGLSGARLQISQDGVQLSDMSASSPDHAVAADPASAEQIEIIRGPKILLSSSSCIGGVVDIKKHDIPNTIPDKSNITLLSAFESMNNGRYLGLNSVIPYKDLALKMEYSSKKSDEIHSPDKILKNTSSSSDSYNFGSAYIHDDYTFGASFSGFDLDYGIPGGFVGAHPNGVSITMKKKTYQSDFIYHFHADFIDDLKINLSSTRYKHSEYEAAGLIGAEFVINDYFANVHFIQHSNPIFDNGSFGFSFMSKDLQLGGYVFTPPTLSKNFSIFTVQDKKIEDFDIQFGARFEYNKITPAYNKIAKIGNIREREFPILALSLTVLRELDSNIYLGFNISKSSRTPSAEELFSEGPHLAAYSYETGNPNLEAENGAAYELFAIYKKKNFNFSLTAFYNNMWNFIIPRNSGDTNYAQLLPIYATSGVAAEFRGIESKLEWEFADFLHLLSNLSYTEAYFSDNKKALPSIPPLKSSIELKYITSSLNLMYRFEYGASQTKVDTFEEKTDAYQLHSISSAYIFNYENVVFSLSASIENLLNSKWYNHLSRIKSIMPEAGRNFKLNLRVLY